MIRLSLRLPVHGEAAGAARHCVESLEYLVDGGALDNLKLLVSELVTNSVRHAGLGPADCVDVEVVVDDSRIRVEVKDSGRGFRAADPMPFDEGASGWGLYLVDRLADRWGVERDGPWTDVWFEVSPASSLRTVS